MDIKPTFEIALYQPEIPIQAYNSVINFFTTTYNKPIGFTNEKSL